MWNKNVTDLDSQEVAKSQRILKKYNLRVTDIASPLYKVDWPGAPNAKGGQRRDQFHSDVDFKDRTRCLERSIAMVKVSEPTGCAASISGESRTRRRRRGGDQRAPGRRPRFCAKSNIILLLENEMSCNTATGAEAAATLKGVPNKNFMLNWDPGNAGTFPEAVPTPTVTIRCRRSGSTPPREGCGRQAGGKYEWAAVGTGLIDWVDSSAPLSAMAITSGSVSRNSLAWRRNARGLYDQHAGAENRAEKGGNLVLKGH